MYRQLVKEIAGTEPKPTPVTSNGSLTAGQFDVKTVKDVANVSITIIKPSLVFISYFQRYGIRP